VVNQYGNWKKDGENFYLSQQYMMSGVSKDFIFEINLPKTSIKIGDEQRNVEIIDVKVSAYDIQNKKYVDFHEKLTCTFYNEDENVPQQEEDE
jgi:hypothetical protein